VFHRGAIGAMVRAMTTPFVRRLLDRHAPTKGSAPNEEAIALASAAASLEILLRAARACQVAPITPATKPSRDQLLTLVFGAMSTIGLGVEASVEGAKVGVDSLRAATVMTFLPTHSPLEQAEIGTRVSRVAAELSQSSPAFANTVGRLAVVIVRETPARLPTERSVLSDGKPVEDLLAPLLRTLLNSNVDAPLA
jgi:hypothetical protein